MSSTPINGEPFPQSVVEQLMVAVQEGKEEACRILWGEFKGILIENWFIVLIVLLAIPALAYIKFTTTGRWGSLASVAYHYLYGIVLLVIVGIFGPEIFANPWIKLVLFIVYAVCFSAVGVFIRIANSIADIGGRSYR